MSVKNKYNNKYSDKTTLTDKNTAKYRCYMIAKRTFDIITSLFVLVFLSPIIIIILLVKFLEDFHNPIYVSERVGKDGKPFPFFKIRSMWPDADRRKAKMIAEGLNEADGPAFKMKNDLRITPVGKFLRKWSLDEILQFINVLFGHISVVGPRSPLPDEVEKYTEYHMRRLEIKGGLLCLWQIQPNRHDIKFDKWVELDIEYIEHQNFALDMKIIFTGVYMILSGKSGD